MKALAVSLPLLIILTSFFAVRIISYRTKKRKRYQRIRALKKNGLRIAVDLEKCTFSEDDFAEEEPHNLHYDKKYTYKGLWNVICGKPFDYDYRTQYATTVFYNAEIDNDTICFSKTIPKDVVTLTFLFQIQKETYIYVDKNNYENHYFDLSFLYQE
jgi:hypothetical protein